MLPTILCARNRDSTPGVSPRAGAFREVGLTGTSNRPASPRRPTRRRFALTMTRAPRPTHLVVPDYGIGAGLRVVHYRHVLEQEAKAGFFEVISENFFVRGGKPLYHLDQFCERYRMILHGVSLNIGGPDEPSRNYLNQLKALVKRVNPPWISDHFCFCGAGGAHMHDLLPLPYTEEAARRIARRAKTIQDFLEVPLGLENTSSYLTYTSSTMSEWEFISRIVEEADCGLMFDVNNVYVSAYNHGFDPLEFIRNIPHERILQIHLAGHTNMGRYIIDTHVGPASGAVMDLYRETTRLSGPVSTLLEWDDEIPTFDVLETEIARIGRARSEGLSPACPPLERDVVDRIETVGRHETTETAGAGERAWAQGGPVESLATWSERPSSDALDAELASTPAPSSQET